MKKFAYITYLVITVLIGGFSIYHFAWAQGIEDGSFSTYLPIIQKPSPRLYQIGPSGGKIVTIALHPLDASILYAGTWGAGLFKSSDGGSSWTEFNQGLGNLYIQSLAIDPQKPDIIYAGTYGAGVYKTIDGGANWFPTGPGLNVDPIVYTLAIDPIHTNILYAGTRRRYNSTAPWGGGAYKSIDGGGSWFSINNTLGEDWVYDIAVAMDPSITEPNTIYAATHQKGVYRSTNGGAVWYSVNNGLEADLGDDGIWSSRSLAINHQDAKRIYLGTWHTTSMFKTNDGGNLWYLWNDGFYGERVYKIKMDPTNKNIIYAATLEHGVMKTSNAGEKWQYSGPVTIAGQPSSMFIYDIQASKVNNNLVVAGSEGEGLFKSLDAGLSWVKSHQGIFATSVTSILASPDAPADILVSTFGGGIQQTNDAGQTWVDLNIGLLDKWINFVEQSPIDSRILYAGSNVSGIYISYDHGISWQRKTSGIDVQIRQVDLPLQSEWLDHDLFSNTALPKISMQNNQLVATTSALTAISLAAHPTDPLIIYMGTAQGLYRTTNGGNYWANIPDPIHALAVYDIEFDPFTPSNILVAAGNLFRSKNNGSTWEMIEAGAGLFSISLAPDPYTPNTYYMGTKSGIYMSQDGGDTWSLYGLAGNPINVIRVSSATELLVGTDTGLYKGIRGNAGATWSRIEDLNDKKIPSLTLMNKPCYLAGTETDGVYYYSDTLP